MTTTAPATTRPAARAPMAARSPSKPRAVPVKTDSSKPADFTTAPSGASEPLRMVRPPVLWIGRSSERMTASSIAGGAAGLGNRPVQRAHGVVVDRGRGELLEVLGQRPAGHGQAVAVHEPGVEQ